MSTQIIRYVDEQSGNWIESLAFDPEQEAYCYSDHTGNTEELSRIQAVAKYYAMDQAYTKLMNGWYACPNPGQAFIWKETEGAAESLGIPEEDRR